MYFLIRILFVPIALLFSLHVSGSNLILNSDFKHLELQNNTSYWFDSTGIATVWDVVNKPLDAFRLAKNRDDISNKKNIWLRYDFENHLQGEQQLTLTLGIVKEAHVMIYAGRSQFLFKKCGCEHLPDGLLLNTVSTSFNIPSQWQQFTIFVYLPSTANNFDNVQCSLLNRDHFESHKNGHALISGILAGFILILLLYHFCMFLFLYDRTYLYFCGYLIVLMVLTTQDFYFLKLYNYPLLLGSLAIISNCLAPVLFTQFSRRIIDISYHSERIDILLNWTVKILSISGSALIVFLLITQNINLTLRILYFILVLSFVSALVLHVLLFRIKNKITNLFLFGTLVLLVCLISGFSLMYFFENKIAGIVLIDCGIGLQLLFFSVSLSAKYRQTQTEKVEAQTELICQLEENQQLQLQLTSELEDKVRERTQQIVIQKQEIEEKNRQIMSSIDYAKLIQQAMLPSAEEMSALMPLHFVLYKPRDVVGGDFYWTKKMELSNGESMLLVAAADCTGHGVPGGFISMLGLSLLNEISNRLHLTELFTAADILEQMRYQLKYMLKHSWKTASKDGMDIALCLLNMTTLQLQYSGANAPVVLVTNGELMQLKPTRNPIGIHPNELAFHNQTVQLAVGDCLYLFSDGFLDQFGGEDYKRFSSARFRQLLFDIHQLKFDEQCIVLEKALFDWKTTNEQMDDIMVLGIKI